MFATQAPTRSSGIGRSTVGAPQTFVTGAPAPYSGFTAGPQQTFVSGQNPQFQNTPMQTIYQGPPTTGTFPPTQQAFLPQQSYVSQPTYLPQQSYVTPQVVNQEFYAQGPTTTTTQMSSAVGQAVKGESRIEYVPYQREVTEYITQEVVEYLPIEKKVTDYYAVQYDTEYIPQVIQEKYIEYVPVEQLRERVEYQAIEKQTVIHEPNFNQTTTQQTYVQPQQSYVQTQQTFVQPQQTFVQPQQTFLPPTQTTFAQPPTYLQQQPVQFAPQQFAPSYSPQRPTQFAPTQYQPGFPHQQPGFHQPGFPHAQPQYGLPGQAYPPNMISQSFVGNTRRSYAAPPMP